MGGSFDALLVLSFGGPEKPEDVEPFLDNVLRGRHVPDERRKEVAGHYLAFQGRSPLNDQNRALVEALRAELEANAIRLPVYWGNRNWRPFLADTLREMARDGVRRSLAFVTSTFSSYSGCRQYLEDIAAARALLGASAPEVEKLRGLFNHPGFVEACADRLRAARADAGPDAPVLFTAHSLPAAMAATCAYEEQFLETAGLVAGAAGTSRWSLAYQSRSGPPSQPWLEPGVDEELRRLAREGARAVVVSPIGFLSDHMEVVYDLDTAARATAESAGLRLVRAGTAGTHPGLVAAVRELVQERTHGAPRRSLGRLPPLPDACPDDCCPPGRSRPG
ncbi:MAG TPA: ferrochelatase [Vicinamibacteria bacterium]|nr:ferrochelatase [Vicinamibacteria bacterium]